MLLECHMKRFPGKLTSKTGLTLALDSEVNTYHNSYFQAERNNEKEDNGDIEEPEKTNDDHPVFQAIKDSKDNVEVVRDYFEIHGLSVEKQDTAGMTVLMHACWKGYENIVKFLIKQV